MWIPLSSLPQFNQLESFFASDGSRRIMFFYQECSVSVLENTSASLFNFNNDIFCKFFDYCYESLQCNRV